MVTRQTILSNYEVIKYTGPCKREQQVFVSKCELTPKNSLAERSVLLNKRFVMSGGDRRQSTLQSERSTSFKILCRPRKQGLTGQRSIVTDAAGERAQNSEEIAHRTQKYLNQQYQNQLAFNEQQQYIKWEMEQQKEFLAHQFQVLKEAVEAQLWENSMTRYAIERSGRVPLVKHEGESLPIKLKGPWRG